MKRSLITPRVRWWLALCGLGVLAAGAQLYATSSGLATSPDSRYYIEAARRLAATGHLTTTAGGMLAPLIRFPPLLSVVLAGAGVVGVDPLAAARFLNAGLLFTNVVLVGRLIHTLSAGAGRLALAGAGLAAGLPALLQVYVWAWSEPLFIGLLLLSFLVLAGEAGRDRPGRLALAGLLVGLAGLTRYVGGAFAADMALWLALQPGPGRARRLAPFLAASALPIGLWALRNVLLIGRPTEYILALRGIHAAKFAELPGTGFISYLAVLSLALVAAVLLRVDLRAAWRRMRPGSALSAIWLALPVYGAAVLLSIAFLDPGIPLEDRILSPALTLLIVASFSTLAYVTPPPRRARLVWLSAATLYGGCALAAMIGLASFAARLQAVGDGFNSRAWQSSPTIAAMRAWPPDALIYSNGEEAIYLLTGRTSRSLPRPRDGDYPLETAALRRDLEANQGTVVIFAALAYRDFMSRADLVSALPPLAAVELADGVIMKESAGSQRSLAFYTQADAPGR